MPPPLVVTNACQVKLYYALGTELGVNVFGANITGTVTFDQALADALGAAIKSAFTTYWGPQCATSVSLARVGVRDLRTANQPEYRDVGAAVVGTGTGDPLPYSSAVCITFRTSRAGASFRGRVYLPGASESANDATGRISTAASNAAVSFIGASFTAFNANGLAASVISRPSERYTVVKTTFHADGTTTTETISNVAAKTAQSTTIISFEARTPEWESQRRRINRRSVAPVLAGPVVKVDL